MVVDFEEDPTASAVLPEFHEPVVGAEHLEVIGPTRKSLISPAEQAAAQDIKNKDLKPQRWTAGWGRGSGGRLQSRSPGGARGPSG